MSFTESGIYKIDRSKFSEMGFDINQIDPRNIAIYGNGGGMLPQSNSASRVSDLFENAITVIGESDGVFNAEDYILFYVDDPHERIYNPVSKTFRVQKNLYSEELHYFVTVKESFGNRISIRPNMGIGFPTIDFYNKIIWHEEDLVNILGSGREWYGERFDILNERIFDLGIDEITPSQEIKLSISAMSQSFIPSSMEVQFGSRQVDQLNFNAIANARYTRKGNEKSENFTIPSDNLGSNPQLNLSYNRNGSTSALGFLNSFLIDVPTPLTLKDGQTAFRSTKSLDNSISAFSIENLSSESIIWDVTAPLTPTNQSFLSNETVGSFSSFSDELREYIVFNPSETTIIEEFEIVQNQNLHGISTPEFLIITPEDFKGQANRLATFRRENDDLEVTVVELQPIYNEFASGRQDITAIRDFIRHLYQQSDKLKYVLLFGKGSYDYKSRVSNNTNFMPTYEARNSLSPLESYSSDDFFGFLDEDEGEWIESKIGDHLLEIGIGRIPATSEKEAIAAVDKIIGYQSSPDAYGDWRSRLLFVADDGDNNIHQRDADQLATLVDTSYSDFNVQKLFLDAFDQERLPNGEFSPAAQEALFSAIEQGVLILNFTGHGAETGWMQERVLTLELIDELTNKNNLPLLVTATCEFGRNDDPSIVSGAEKMLFKENGGAIALITTARPVFSSTNYDLNLALYGSILEQEGGQYARLGDIIRFTKNNSLNGSSNRNFVLLGDPSMRLAYPDKEIKLELINGSEIVSTERDTLRALEKVTISGIVETQGTKDMTFQGTVKFELRDKRQTSQTKGTESQVFKFEERNSKLFNGTASVIDGEFEVEFVVPKNIDYNWGTGKMVMYAINKSGTSDALGSYTEFIIGGTAQSVTLDTDPPEIQAYINDTLLTAPYFTKPNANLLIRISDDNGINISETGVGQEITAYLNDSVLYDMNPFFSTNLNDFTSGWVNFPLRNLHLGKNSLVIKAWDNHNNSATSALEFIVNDENSTLITDITNYPNPFVTSTTFSVAHNSVGDQVEMAVEIYNGKGEKITTIYDKISSSRAVEKLTWDGTNFEGAKLDNGIYIYNVILRSVNGGKIASKRQKLIISN